MNEQSKEKLLRLTKLLISVAYFCGSGLKNLFASLVGITPRGTCTAIHYHAVAPHERKRFARQMDILKLHAKPLAADNDQPLQAGQHYAVVTFDDGFMSAVENAVPELVERNIPMTFFIPAGLLGTIPQWTEFGLDEVSEEIIATARCLRELPSDLITIGSHTMTHAWLPSLSDNEAKFEVSNSRTELEKLLDRKITLFSFPYGASNGRLLELCREAGYDRVFTILPTPAFTDPKEFVTGRIAVNSTDWELEFRLKILGAYKWLPAVIALKRKLLGKHLDEQPKVSPVGKGTRSAQYGLN
jgi:peptidoglycan/xylan/chitin deacetylase (PgdA/CDA1 family)